jgi:hypothetical protein
MLRSRLVRTTVLLALLVIPLSLLNERGGAPASERVGESEGRSPSEEI